MDIQTIVRFSLYLFSLFLTNQLALNNTAMKFIYFSLCCLLLFACKDDDGFVSDNTGGVDLAFGCEGVSYPNWETSPHNLPYPVGQSYKIGLTHCSGSGHAEGDPDQFAIDFMMNSGTLVTASRKGTIMFVEESGMDFSPTNNVVILRDEDGFFLHYQHLTHNGAMVEEGDLVEVGDPIGRSGASGTTFAHLHFVATRFGDWMIPYSRSFPITFGNTTENEKSLLQGQTYESLPYVGD